MKKIILNIGGMSCSACSNGLEKYLNKQPEIKKASVNLVLSQALITYDDILTIDDINEYIKEAGFENLGVYNSKTENNYKKDKKLLIFFLILSIIILYISMSHMIGLPTILFLNPMKYPINYSILLFLMTIPFLVYGIDIFKSGYKNLIHKTPNMDTLVSIGVISSFIYSLFGMIMIILGNTSYVETLYFESSAIVIFFIKLGRFIDSKSKEKTRDSIKGLVQVTPTNALLKKGNDEIEITIDEVKKGDILIAKPGMKIAVDGVIVKGETHLDESIITGEAMGRKKMINDKVIAGSLNIDGYIEYKAEKIGKESTISEIVRLVVEAVNTKPKISKLADKVSSYFVPSIIVIAIVTFIGYLLFGFSVNEALSSFVNVLVVACPCALGLATPLAIVVSVGLCAKNGILVKTSEILENAKDIDTVVFDKTGTLTYGNLKISEIINYSNYSDNDLLILASSLELKSSHPISKAFGEYTKCENLKVLEVDNFKNIDGIGISGIINKKQIYLGNNKLLKKIKIDNNHLEDEKKLSSLANSIVYIIEDKKVIGLIGVKDIVRENVVNIIDKLHHLKKEVIMLTGDNDVTAKIIADKLNIKTVISNVMPNEKTNVIKNLINKGKKVMMVGDGVNDAPALASSNIGVSVSSGTDIASSNSDVILMNDDLDKIISLMIISKKTIRNIKQNLFWAFFYNVCMIPIAIGLLKQFNIYLNPSIAGLAMMFSSLTVVFNALRLKKMKL